MPPSNSRKTQDSESMKDYRCMLYRLDLATSFASFEDLLGHFMKETLYDGFIEIRVYSVASSPSSSTGTFPTPSSRLSFIRDSMTGEVVADRLFKPAHRPHDPNNLYRQQYKVVKSYPERPLLVDVFRPFIESLLYGNKSTLIFEYRAFLEQSISPFDEFEVVTRQVPHKLMVGYIGRSEQGPLAVYQLDENIARTAFLDMNPMSFQPCHPGSELGRDPTVVESIPNRFQALQGKTIAIDGTLITQRLFYAPDPRPRRHVLGWYQLIQELRQNEIKVICVFDGKGRIPAKLNEVERRKLLRSQAQARGIWEKSRHKRLLSLTQTLRTLEGLPTEHQQEVLKTLQASPELIPPSQDPTPSPPSPIVPQDREGVTKNPDQAPSVDANLSTGGLLPSETNNLGTVFEPDAANSLLPESPEATGGPSGSKQSVECDTRVSKLPNSIIPSDGPILKETPSDHAPQAIPPSQIPLPEVARKSKDTEDRKSAVREVPSNPSENQFGDQRHTLDVGDTDGSNKNLPSPQWTEAKLRIHSLKNEDNKAIACEILDLFDHYNQTTTSGPDGKIPAVIPTNSDQDVAAIPISRVQLKYTQEEAQLWKQLASKSDGATMDLARVVEMVERFASVELPSDEIPTDVATLEEEVEPPISERSAKLEEQSGLMAASFARRASPPTALTYAESRLILEAMGIPCIQSSLPYEAEALACSLVLNGIADFVGSEDTDVLMYNAPLLRNMTDKKVPLQVIPPSVEKGLDLSRTSFIDAAILMGTDFVKRIGGIGPTTAWRLMHQYGSIEAMLEQEPRFRPADIGEYLEQVKVARMIFGTIPPVPSAEDITQGPWDEQAVYDVMSMFELQEYVEGDRAIPDVLSANYYDSDSEAKALQ